MRGPQRSARTHVVMDGVVGRREVEQVVQRARIHRVAAHVVRAGCWLRVRNQVLCGTSWSSAAWRGDRAQPNVAKMSHRAQNSRHRDDHDCLRVRTCSCEVHHSCMLAVLRCEADTGRGQSRRAKRTPGGRQPFSKVWNRPSQCPTSCTAAQRAGAGVSCRGGCQTDQEQTGTATGLQHWTGQSVDRASSRALYGVEATRLFKHSQTRCDPQIHITHA